MRMWPRSKVRRLEDEIAELRTVTAGLAQGADWLSESMNVRATYSGKRVTVEDAFGLGAVYAAVSIIAETVGSLPLKVYRKQDGGVREEADRHRSFRMLHDKPNQSTIAHRFWSTVTVHLLLWGNAYLRKERNLFTDEVDQLWLLDPSAVEVKWNGRSKKFVIQGPPKKEWDEEEVCHITGLSVNGVYGESPIGVARNMFGTAMSRDEFEGGFYKRGAKFPGVIEYPGRLGEQGIKNLAEGFAKHHGAGNMHRTPILEEGATFKATQMPLEDMQFVEGKQLSRSEIATIFKLPPSYLAASSGDSLTYATVEGNNIQFAQMAIMPWCNVIAKSVSQDPEILPQNVMYAEFVIEGLMRADKKTEAEYLEKLHAMGVISEAYVAELLNLPKPPPPKPVPAALAPFAEPGGAGNGNVRPDDVPSQSGNGTAG